MTAPAATHVPGALEAHANGFRLVKMQALDMEAFELLPGDTLDSTATVEAIREEGGQKLVDLKVSTVNQDGKEVVSGSATSRID